MTEKEVSMAPRATWKGYLKLSLVSCPVRLYNATSSSNRVSFHLLHKHTHNRIRMVPHDAELGPVDREDLVKGYEYEKDQYIIIEPADEDNRAACYINHLLSRRISCPRPRSSFRIAQRRRARRANSACPSCGWRLLAAA
jgi:hypothetical protein